MTDTERRLPGWVLPAGLGLLVVALVAIALLRGPTQLNPETPEGTVQEYLVAINEGHWDDAVEILHEDWRGSCQGVHVQSSVHSDFSAQLGWEGRGGGGIFFEDIAAVEGDTPPRSEETVEVTIHHNEGFGLGSGWDEHVAFELVDDGGFWWLVGDPWPYFTWNCAPR